MKDGFCTSIWPPLCSQPPIRSYISACTALPHSQISDFPAYIRTVAAPYLNVTHPIQYDFMPRVYVHAHHIPENQFPSLYKAANALVTPTHGEGWGRPQIEVSGGVWLGEEMHLCL